MTAIIALKKAIYSILTENGLSVSTGLPINTEMPYVQVGGVDFMDSSVKCFDMDDMQATYHVWDWAHNEENFYLALDKTINLILNDLPELESPFHVEFSNIIMSEVVFDKMETEAVLHGVVRFSFKISKK